MSRLFSSGFKKSERTHAGCRPRVVLLVLALIFQASTAFARSEDQVKAAFLLNFARYVEWPAAAFENQASEIKICVVDSADFAGVIAATISGKTVGDRRLATDSVASVEAASACHILFVGAPDSETANKARAMLADAAVFSVADDVGFAAKGGVANFFRAGNKIRFEINPVAARRAGLKVSSRLLRLARIVE